MNIYEDAGKDMYDIYYDGIIKDAYDTEVIRKITMCGVMQVRIFMNSNRI